MHYEFCLGEQLAVYISDRVPEILIGDPGRFRQIITNLMGNSIKVSPNWVLNYRIQVCRLRIQQSITINPNMLHLN